MNEVNKTLYIPLYGKYYVSKKGIILEDSKAACIWEKEGFELKGKAKSKWLAYYMGMRASVFDEWVKEKIKHNPEALVLHIGCGMDSRIERVGADNILWYDIDFPSVLEERKKYYQETELYHMYAADAGDTKWIKEMPGNATVIVVMEGISMYLEIEKLENLFRALKQHFGKVHILMDCYTTLAAKVSKYKNPINEVGAYDTIGLDDPTLLAQNAGITYIREHSMTPADKMQELKGFEKVFFKSMFAGNLAGKLYRLYEFKE